MNRERIVLVGAGGHARVVAEIIQRVGRFCIAGYTAPAPQAPDSGWDFPFLGNDEVLPRLREMGISLAALGVGGTGDNRPRRELFTQIAALGFSFPPLIHPTAVVASGASLSEGLVVAPAAVVNPGSVVGRNVIINTGAVVEHDTWIGDHVHIAPRAVLCGGVRVGCLAHVGAGAVLIQGVAVGEGAVVGAGAVVIRDVEPWTVAVGNPARVIKRIADEV